MSQFAFELNKTISQGDSRVIKLVFDQAIDTWEFYYTAKRNSSDTDDQAVIKVNPSDTTMLESSVDYTNIVEIPLESTSTNIEPYSYIHDIKVIKPGNIINTIAVGKLHVTPHVTDRNTE